MKFLITRRGSFNHADGICAFVFSLSDALIEMGHEVILLSASNSQPEKAQANFASCRHTAMYSLLPQEDTKHSAMFKAWKSKGLSLVQQIKPDFVIINGALPFRIPFPNCILSHDLERRFTYTSLLRRLYKIYCYRNADRILATCSELRDALAKEIFVKPEAIAVIPTCVDLKTYQSLPLAEREAAILHMGMPVYKNPSASIRAFALLQCPAKLYITGKPTPEVKELLLSLPAEIRERIHLVGIVPAAELKRLLATVRVLSVPSDYYAPVASPTVIDGLASGTPVIGTFGISSDLIVDGESGFRIGAHDTAAIASKMELLLTDDAAWQQASAGAKKRSTRFSNSLVASAYIDLAIQANGSTRKAEKSSPQITSTAENL